MSDRQRLLREATSGSDPYTNLFGAGLTELAARKYRKFVGYDTSGNPIYRYELTTNSGIFYTRLGTAGGSSYSGQIQPTRTTSSSGTELPSPSVVVQPSSDGNIIAGDELLVPGGITPILATGTSLNLREAKADLTAWVNQYAHIWGEDELRSKISQINAAKSTSTLQNLQSDWKNILRLQPAWDPVYGDPETIDLGGGGGGGGGGRGALGPQYRAPDRRLVESFVKGELVTLVGNVPDGMLDNLVNLYMTDHRRNFDSLAVEIDPGMSVREAIRDTALYKNIHKNRPESQDEERWIAERRAAAAQGGLNVNLQEDFAIRQAQAAGDVADVVDAAGVAQFQATGNVAGTTMEAKMKAAATNLFRGVVR